MAYDTAVLEFHAQLGRIYVAASKVGEYLNMDGNLIGPAVRLGIPYTERSYLPFYGTALLVSQP